MRRLPALALLALLTLPAAAHAGSQGRWDRVTSTNESNTDQIGLVRRGGGPLQVAWVRHATALTQNLVVRTIRPGGALGPEETVTTGWKTMHGPDIVRDGGDGARIFFSGQQIGVTGEEHENLSSTFSSSTGASFALEAGSRARGNNVYQSDVGAGRTAAGVALEAWYSTLGVNAHVGLVPSTNPNYQSLLGGGCCGYSPDFGTDGAGGAMWLAWASNATGHPGVFVARVDPATGAPAGAALLMPGSVTTYAGRAYGNQQLSRTPITGRPGRPGVYVAYPGGYPETTRVLLWRTGAARSVLVARDPHNVRDVGIAADPTGRLWVFWHSYRNGHPRVFARRSNPAMTAFGATVSYGGPRGANTAYHLFGDAQRDRLDLVGEYQLGRSLGYWSSQIRPGLSLGASRVALQPHRRLTVTFRVADAGVAVAGARVRVAGAAGTTNGTGRVTLHLGPLRPGPRRITARASHAGYAGTSRSLRVLRG